MNAQDTTAEVLAGGKGPRLGSLTRHHCKAGSACRRELPQHRFLAVELRQLEHCDIGIATQYKPEARLRHIDEVWSRHARRTGEFIEAWPYETRPASCNEIVLLHRAGG